MFHLTRTQRLTLLLLTTFVAGCQSDDVQSYRIAGAAHKHAARIKQVLRNVAAQAGLPDRTAEMHDPHLLALYQGTNVYLRGDISDDDIRVATVHSDWPAPHAFKKADSLLAPALSQAFGKRFSIEKWDAERTIVVH